MNTDIENAPSGYCDLSYLNLDFTQQSFRGGGFALHIKALIMMEAAKGYRLFL